MNKYQGAFDTILCKCHTSNQICTCHKATKDKMCLECDIDEALSNIDDLVEKATPRGPISRAIGIFEENVASQVCCPNCKQPIINVWSKADYKPNYCHYCGQKLDWSDE